MKEKPILFSPSMVKAILDGRKTHTRRVIKPQPWHRINERPPHQWCWTKKGRIDDIREFMEHDNAVWWDKVKSPLCMLHFCPYGTPGDILWVREKFALECPYEHADGCGNPEHVLYWASLESDVRESVTVRWRPSIYMPRWASRITLKNIEVRVEQIQDISEVDAQREGWDISNMDVSSWYDPVTMTKAIEWFHGLWDDINASRGFGWDINPWVWVIAFDPLG